MIKIYDLFVKFKYINFIKKQFVYVINPIKHFKETVLKNEKEIKNMYIGILKEKEYFLENGWVEEDNGVYLKENGTTKFYISNEELGFILFLESTEKKLSNDDSKWYESDEGSMFNAKWFSEISKEKTAEEYIETDCRQNWGEDVFFGDIGQRVFELVKKEVELIRETKNYESELDLAKKACETCGNRFRKIFEML